MSENKVEECPICFEPFEKKNKDVVKLVCGHSFCRVCLINFRKSELNQNCPICCFPIKDNDKIVVFEDIRRTSYFCYLC